MKFKSVLTIMFITSMLAVNFSFGQTNINQTKNPHAVFGDNVDSPLTEKELQFVQEVYGSSAQTDILNNPQRLKDVKNILRNRVEIIEVPNKNLSGIQTLSTVPLFKAYNKSLQRDISLDQNNFNPLKYQFNFHSRDTDKIYRFDNTQYLIIIKSQFPQ